MATAPRKTYYLPNNTAYDLWAPTYNTDGNILQSLDSLALSTTLFPRLLSAIPPNHSPLLITDLGCGTNRATLALLTALQDISTQNAVARLLSASPGTGIRQVHITGPDSSPKMLEISRSQTPPFTNLSIPQQTLPMNIHTTLQLHDILSLEPNKQEENPPQHQQTPSSAP